MTSGDERWLEHDGVRLFALDMGSGRVVVFLHGGLADHRAALFRAGAIAQTCRLILPDLRGSGRSTYAGALSWDVLADDVAAWLDHLGVERAVVGGVSMGSGVALRFGLRHPQRTAGLVLIPLYEALPPHVREIAIPMVRGFDAASVAATTRFMATREQPLRSASELLALDVPVMIVPGTDGQHPAEVAQLYAQCCRHALWIDAARADLAERLAAFCAEPAAR